MARYSKIERAISNDKKFNGISDDAQLCFFRLWVHPHLTAIGAMRISVVGFASEMGWSPGKLVHALVELCMQDMLKVDQENHLIWFPHFLKHNPPKSPTGVKLLVKALDYLPECILREEVMRHFQSCVSKLPASFQAVLPDASCPLSKLHTARSFDHAKNTYD